MSEHRAVIAWKRTGPDFRHGKYSREHTWTFDGGVTVPASSSPSAVPVPYSNPAHVDPEEAFVAAIASCHMRRSSSWRTDRDSRWTATTTRPSE
jgi:organic hydroperoxide reductase OsmC/OhrA